jgi:hypothetical protein
LTPRMSQAGFILPAIQDRLVVNIGGA